MSEYQLPALHRSIEGVYPFSRNCTSRENVVVVTTTDMTGGGTLSLHVCYTLRYSVFFIYVRCQGSKRMSHRIRKADIKNFGSSLWKLPKESHLPETLRQADLFCQPFHFHKICIGQRVPVW